MLDAHVHPQVRRRQIHPLDQTQEVPPVQPQVGGAATEHVCQTLPGTGDKRRRLLDDATRAAEILKPGESMTAADFRRAIIGRGITTNKSRLETILAICIENGFIIEREPTKEEKTIPGIKKMIEKPAPPPEQMEFFQSPQVWGD